MHQSTRLNFVIKAHFTSNYGANEEGNEGEVHFFQTLTCNSLLSAYIY